MDGRDRRPRVAERWRQYLIEKGEKRIAIRLFGVDTLLERGYVPDSVDVPVNKIYMSALKPAAIALGHQPGTNEYTNVMSMNQNDLCAHLNAQAGVVLNPEADNWTTLSVAPHQAYPTWSRQQAWLKLGVLNYLHYEVYLPIGRDFSTHFYHPGSVQLSNGHWIASTYHPDTDHDSDRTSVCKAGEADEKRTRAAAPAAIEDDGGSVGEDAEVSADDDVANTIALKVCKASVIRERRNPGARPCPQAMQSSFQTQSVWVATDLWSHPTAAMMKDCHCATPTPPPRTMLPPAPPPATSSRPPFSAPILPTSTPPSTGADSTRLRASRTRRGSSSTSSRCTPRCGGRRRPFTSPRTKLIEASRGSLSRARAS